MKNKICFIFNGRFPSEKADSLFAILDAKSFVDCGIEITMLVPKRVGKREKPDDFYGVPVNFSVKYLPAIDGFYLHLPKSLAYFVSIISFSISCFFYSLSNNHKDTVFYSNEIIPLYPLSFFRKTFYEMHDYPESKKMIFSLMIKRINKILIHNRWKMEKAVKEFSLNKDKIITVPNAVSIKDFEVKENKESLRERFSIPLDKKIIVYTGHLYSWKGAELLSSCAPILPDYEFYFVGGNEKDVNRFKVQFNYGNIHFVGFRSHTEIPLWQKASDCLVLPNTAKEDISKYYTSPMKLFEYMASGTPIVASDIPSIREIVGPQEVTLFEPDNKESLKKAIEFVLNNKTFVERFAHNAKEKVKGLSWDIRAKKIIDFIYNE